jgi:hypothetical protein
MSKTVEYKHLHLLAGISVLLILSGTVLAGTMVCGLYKNVFW